MLDLREYFPTEDSVLQLEPEELAGFLLERYAHDDPKHEPSASLNRHNFAIELRQECRFGEPAVFAFLEAWEWLVREGLFIERSDGWYFVSRRGLRLKGRHGLEAFSAIQCVAEGISSSSHRGKGLAGVSSRRV